MPPPGARKTYEKKHWPRGSLQLVWSGVFFLRFRIKISKNSGRENCVKKCTITLFNHSLFFHSFFAQVFEQVFTQVFTHVFARGSDPFCWFVRPRTPRGWGLGFRFADCFLVFHVLITYQKHTHTASASFMKSSDSSSPFPYGLFPKSYSQLAFRICPEPPFYVQCTIRSGIPILRATYQLAQGSPSCGHCSPGNSAERPVAISPVRRKGR